MDTMTTESIYEVQDHGVNNGVYVEAKTMSEALEKYEKYVDSEVEHFAAEHTPEDGERLRRDLAPTGIRLAGSQLLIR